MSSNSKPSVSLKLLIDTKRQSVLFAESSGNIGGVFSEMLSSPVSNFVSILGKEETAAGSLANLCKSIEGINKNMMINAPTPKAEVYCCISCSKFGDVRQYSDNPHALCPLHGPSLMTKKLKYLAPPPPCEGSAAAAVSYMITDDLVVMPLSTISIMNLLDRFGIKDVGALEEKVVELHIDEAVKLLYASLHSKKALTDLFLTPKPNGNGKGKGVKRERHGEEGVL